MEMDNRPTMISSRTITSNDKTLSQKGKLLVTCPQSGPHCIYILWQECKGKGRGEGARSVQHG